MFRFAPCCGRKPEFVERAFESVKYIYCRHCNLKYPIHNAEEVEEKEWDSINRELMREAVERVDDTPFCPDGFEEPYRPVLDALRRNGK